MFSDVFGLPYRLASLLISLIKIVKYSVREVIANNETGNYKKNQTVSTLKCHFLSFIVYSEVSQRIFNIQN